MSWTESPNPSWKLGQKVSENNTKEGKEWSTAVEKCGFKVWDPEAVEALSVPVIELNK